MGEGRRGTAALPLISDLQKCDTNSFVAFPFFAKSFNFDEIMLRDRLFLLHIKIYEKNYILFNRRAFSEVLEDETYKASPQAPSFLPLHFHVLMALASSSLAHTFAINGWDITASFFNHF